MVANTFYECGIVVPVDKKTQVGYRKIPETDGEKNSFHVNSCDLSTETHFFSPSLMLCPSQHKENLQKNC